MDQLEETGAGGGNTGDAVAGSAVAQGAGAATEAGSAGAATVAGDAEIAGAAGTDTAGVAGSAGAYAAGAASASVGAAERYQALPRNENGHITPLSSEERIRQVTADTSDLLAHLADLKLSGDELLQEVKAWYADTEDDPVFMLAHTPKRLRGRIRAYMRQRGAQLDMSVPIPVSVGTILEATTASVPGVGAGGVSGGAGVGAAGVVAAAAGAGVGIPKANAVGARTAEADATASSTPAATDTPVDATGASTPAVDAAGGNAADASAGPAGGTAAASSTVAPQKDESSAKTDAGSSSYARQSLAKLYTSDEAKYSGRSEQSFALWEKSLRRNMELTGCTTSDAIATIHVTVAGVALRHLMSRLDAKTSFEEALEHLRSTFVSAAATRKAHSDFLALDFASFRSSRRNLAEVDAVNDFYAYAVALQEQLGVDYANDAVLRDRLIGVFSFSKRIAEAFHDAPPATSVDLIARVAARSSRTTERDMLVEPVSDVNWARQQRRTTDYRVRSNGSRGRYNRNGQGTNWNRGSSWNRRSNNRTSRRRACWVCGSFEHFARDIHSREEITKALSQGQNVAAFCALIPADLASEVMQSEMQFSGPGDSDGDDDAGGAGGEDGGDNEGEDAAFADPSGPEAEQDGTYVHLALTPSDDAGEELDADIFNNYACRIQANQIVSLAAEGYALSLSEEHNFHGAYVDTGCVGSSVISETQYRAYCAATLCPYSIDATQVGRVNFGGTAFRNSLGRAMLGIFLQCSETTVWVSAHVMRGTQTPFLLSRNDLDRNGIDIRTLSRTLVHKGKSQPLSLVGGFLVIQWDYSVCLFSEAELHRIHRAFAHRGSDSVYKTLKTAYPETSIADKQRLEKIEEECGPCQRHASAPGHFRVSGGTSAGRFNYVVEADPFFIAGESVMHLKCRGINLVEAEFCGTSAAAIWTCIRRKWIYRYGPMSILRVDQALDTSVLRNGCSHYGIHVDPVPTEAPWRVGAVERSHTILKTSL